MSNSKWPPTGNIKTVSDIDIKIDANGTYNYLSTFMYGVNGIIDTVYKISTDKNNNTSVVEIPKNNYSYDKLIGNIKINLPIYDYSLQFIINYHKNSDKFIYINTMFKNGPKQIIN
jgi:hypothetical protein